MYQQLEYRLQKSYFKSTRELTDGLGKINERNDFTEDFIRTYELGLQVLSHAQLFIYFSCSKPELNTVYACQSVTLLLLLKRLTELKLSFEKMHTGQTNIFVLRQVAYQIKIKDVRNTNT